MEHQTENFDRHHAEQRLVTWFAKNDWSVRIALSNGEMAFRNQARNLVPSANVKVTLRFGTAQGFPHVVRDECIGRSAIDQKACRRLSARGTGQHPSADVTSIDGFLSGQS